MTADIKAHRIAAFFAPRPEHLLWRTGSQWLGRDASCRAASLLASCPVSASVVQAPRRYGFHATFKPPFELRPGIDAGQVGEQTRKLAARLAPFEMPRLSVQWLNGFLALRPVSPQDPGVAALVKTAAEVVRGLDPLRQPASAAQIAARQQGGLTTLEQSMLSQWGYPYVLDAWRFHMTLTGRIPDQPEFAGARADVFNQAQLYFADSLREPLHCEDICLFVEPKPGTEMHVWQRIALTG